MKKYRPTNIQLTDLIAYKFPLAAITSILHRLSGVAVFLMIPFLLVLLQCSLASPESYAKLQECLGSFCTKLFLWLTLSGLFYHLVAGIKHLVMDFGVGETIRGAKIGAQTTLGISIAISLVMAVWLW